MLIVTAKILHRKKFFSKHHNLGADISRQQNPHFPGAHYRLYRVLYYTELAGKALVTQGIKGRKAGITSPHKIH